MLKKIELRGVGTDVQNRMGLWKEEGRRNSINRAKKHEKAFYCAKKVPVLFGYL